MQQPHDDPGFAIRIGLLSVIAFMSWPVWLAVVAVSARSTRRCSGRPPCRFC